MSNETKNESKSKASEAPKADAANAAAQNAFPGFDPAIFFNAWQNPVAAWTSAQTAFQNNMAAAQTAFQNALNTMSSWTGANPFGAFVSSQATFQKAVADSFTRAQAWTDEYAANEAEMTKKAHSAVDAWAALAHDSINYTAQLSAQARKLSFDAARKAGFAGA
jgi:hypothetical protein